MKYHPLVSVVLACYNGMKYLEQQLHSLDAQNYPNFEVVVVDDASTDGTYEYLLDYVSTHHNYTLVCNDTNSGVVTTFEKAILLAKGDYIALCDQDDIWFPSKVQELMLNIDDRWLIHSDANLIDQNGVVIQSSYFKFCKNEINNYAHYLIENNVTGCTCLFKKELLSLIDNKFPRGITVHDHLLAILAARINKIKYLDEVLMSYRQHPTNQIGAVSAVNKEYITRRHLQDLDVLSTKTYFKHDTDLEFAKKYYHVLLKNDSPTLKLIIWIFQKLGAFWCIKYLLKVLLK